MNTITKPINGYHKKGEAEITMEDFRKEAQSLSKPSPVPPLNNFPIDIFPDAIKDFINENVLAFQLPAEYYGATILTMAAAIIGNTYQLHYKNNYEVPTTLYMSIIGHPSSGKTPAMKACLTPLFSIEARMNDEYIHQLAQWEIECEMLQKGQPTPPKPTRKEIMVNDITIEALNEVLRNNPNGLLMNTDELLGWINGMNQYRKGADEQFWLSVWSNSQIKVNRVSKETILIPKPNICVIGGLQPDLLKTLGAGDKRNSGFLFRILFAFPSDLKKPMMTEYEPRKSVIIAYNDHIQKLYESIENTRAELNENTEKITVLLSPEAKQIYANWTKQLTMRSNEDSCGSTMSINGKMEQYCLRFALVLDTLRGVEQMEKGFTRTLFICEDIINGAIHLTEYFMKNAFRVMDIIDDVDPLSELDETKKSVYHELPATFKTKQGEIIAIKKGMKKRTYQRFIKNKTLFRNQSRGEYHKII